MVDLFRKDHLYVCCVSIVFLFSLLSIFGCSTDAIPRVPDPESRANSVSNDISTDQLMRTYSSDFNRTYSTEAPWGSHMLVYLTVRFLARNGLERFEELSDREKALYDGVQKFKDRVKPFQTPWAYAADLSLKTLHETRVRETFRTDLNFSPFQNFAVGKWVKYRIESDQELPDFGAGSVRPEIRKPIIRAAAMILMAQYALQSYETITEPTVLEEEFQRDIRWLLNQWRQNYLRIRSIWPPEYDLTTLSPHTLSPLYEIVRGGSSMRIWEVNPADRRFGRSTLPFRDIYDVSVENISSRLRMLQRQAIEEYIERRFHSSLRHWLQILTYSMKFRLVNDLMNKWEEERSDVDFYARNALQDIRNILMTN